MPAYLLLWQPSPLLKFQTLQKQLFLMLINNRMLCTVHIPPASGFCRNERNKLLATMMPKGLTISISQHVSDLLIVYAICHVTEGGGKWAKTWKSSLTLNLVGQRLLLLHYPEKWLCKLWIHAVQIEGAQAINILANYKEDRNPKP